jgi:hypothetical protein
LPRSARPSVVTDVTRYITQTSPAQVRGIASSDHVARDLAPTNERRRRSRRRNGGPDPTRRRHPEKPDPVAVLGARSEQSHVQTLPGAVVATRATPRRPGQSDGRALRSGTFASGSGRGRGREKRGGRSSVARRTARPAHSSPAVSAGRSVLSGASSRAGPARRNTTQSEVPDVPAVLRHQYRTIGVDLAASMHHAGRHAQTDHILNAAWFVSWAMVGCAWLRSHSSTRSSGTPTLRKAAEVTARSTPCPPHRRVDRRRDGGRHASDY